GGRRLSALTRTPASIYNAVRKSSYLDMPPPDVCLSIMISAEKPENVIATAARPIRYSAFWAGMNPSLARNQRVACSQSYGERFNGAGVRQVVIKASAAMGACGTSDPALHRRARHGAIGTK